MNAQAKAALQAIQTTIETQTRKLSRPDYRDVLEEVATHVQLSLDAVNSELADDE